MWALGMGGVGWGGGDLGGFFPTVMVGTYGGKQNTAVVYPGEGNAGTLKEYLLLIGYCQLPWLRPAPQAGTWVMAL